MKGQPRQHEPGREREEGKREKEVREDIEEMGRGRSPGNGIRAKAIRKEAEGRKGHLATQLTGDKEQVTTWRGGEN